jgi:hypothetical protein
VTNLTLVVDFGRKSIDGIATNSTVSNLYGMIKLQKTDKGLRPICTGYNVLFTNSHVFLKKMFEPILKQCTFFIDSPRQFEERFLADLPKYDSEIHTVVSFDAVKLHTTVNVNRAVSHVLDVVYASPDLHFTEQDENGKKYPAPLRSNFRVFIQNVLKDFNIFENK